MFDDYSNFSDFLDHFNASELFYALTVTLLQLTPEEEERRQLRRERNKLAAAKCRQKRVDQTNQLLAVRTLNIFLIF